MSREGQHGSVPLTGSQGSLCGKGRLAWQHEVLLCSSLSLQRGPPSRPALHRGVFPWLLEALSIGGGSRRCHGLHLSALGARMLSTLSSL